MKQRSLPNLLARVITDLVDLHESGAMKSGQFGAYYATSFLTCACFRTISMMAAKGNRGGVELD